ncbi:MAG: amidohydrolase family protein [Desulfovibrio sp.]|nr:amidohydrolase family protein [Desulfovibrio sp.]
MPDVILAIRARTVLPLADEQPARGVRLLEALKKIDDAVIVTRDGIVEEIAPFKRARLPAGCTVQDFGPVTLAPACVNAHAHLQLSFLAGKTCFGRGFTAWINSFIRLLKTIEDDVVLDATNAACAAMAAAGTAHVGDISGSIAHGLLPVRQACREAGIGVTHFCEWFGFVPPLADGLRPWPPRLRDEMAEAPDLPLICQPSGHALYSTAPDVLRDAKAWCAEHGRPFCLHLAESPDETELLASGSGPLYELYRNSVLPEGWKAPGMRPLALAAALGLLGQGTLAIHGTQLDDQEVEVLAASGTALCLCPRSNRNLAVGTAPVRTLMENGSLLCLGTDGLSSNTDLDVRLDAVWLRETFDVPPEALIRMLTVNGAAALGIFGTGLGRLAPGCPAKFCRLPEELVF